METPRRSLSPLARARRRAGLSQVQLAAKLEPPCHPATLATAERGALSRSLAQRCADALGVPVEELLGEAHRGVRS